MNRKALWTVTCLLLASCMAASLPAQEPPTITLPKPTGQLGVGTVVWHWPDPDRLDELSPAPDDVREVMAQVWYPADTAAAVPTGVYSPIDNDIDHVTGWSQPGVPFTSQIRKAPLIAICPGARISRTLYTSLAEDLASHGYVVLVPDFPYVGFVAYPDGREIFYAFPVPPVLQTGPYSGIDQFFETPGALAAGDLRLALDNLEKITDDDPARRLTGRIDWHQLGLFGHSLGSKACGAVAAEGNRFDAVASMEGAFPIAVRERGVKAPVLLMFGVGLPERIRDTIRQLIPNRGDDIYDLTIPNFLHNNVNELAIIYPTLFPSLMDPYVGLEQTRVVLRTFFDQHIKETGPGVLSLPSQIPGATVQFYPGPGHH